jgi:hypothetical protein
MSRTARLVEINLRKAIGDGQVKAILSDEVEVDG